MNALKITNFITIKHAQLEIKDLNILIGPQASGKSVIAKLLYFFKKFVNETIPKSARESIKKAELIKEAISEFTKIFPKYSWENQEFHIEYMKGDVHIKISQVSKPGSKTKLSFHCSENLNAVTAKISKAIKKKQKIFEEESKANSKHKAPFELQFEFSKITRDIMRQELGVNSLEDPTFIPAGRSFFANLQKNVFSFLAGNIEIDPFLKEFGSAYEHAKNMLIHREGIARSEKILIGEIDALIQSILRGKFQQDKSGDWIQTDHCRINVANSSSGQQEALPMLIILSLLPLFSRPDEKNVFFIEEPEAHLFPEAQHKVIKLLINIYNKTKRNNNFFITTHSPYVLSVLNSCMLAADVIRKSNDENIVLKYKNASIDFENVSAYSVENGIVKNILNSKERLIDVNVIDSASEDINKEFEDLLSLQYGNS